jgi:2-polyprenyl-3-methyl-5-hydroxy-6-metoxy-1,4-benzoquinol methylase
MSSRFPSPFVPFIKYARYLEFLPLDDFNEFHGVWRAMHPEALTQAGLIFGQSARASGRNVLQRLGAFEKLRPFPGGLAADLGCGQGAYTIELAKRFERVIGVDILPTNVEQASAGAHDNVIFRCGPLEDLPLDSEIIDAAFLVEVLDHVAEVETSLSELRRVLKPQAIAYISVPNALFPFETHPVKVGTRFFHPWLFPFLNWTSLHDRIATARIFRSRELSALCESLGLRVLASDYVIAPLEYRIKFMRPILAALGNTWLKPLIGVSLVVAVEKL